MNNSTRQNNLKAFVALHHYPQKRKYTGEPYLVHLESVASMAIENNLEFGYEIGLCHDLLEDTKCTRDELYDTLYRFSYSLSEIRFISCGVEDLTDVYTHEAYPNLNRFNRKSLEIDRLAKISANSQSIKYCDLIDNTKSIITHDANFAKVYLKEKYSLLEVMDKGDHKLYKQCIDACSSNGM